MEIPFLFLRSAIGEEARLMEGRITSDMEIIRPIRQGVIVDYTAAWKSPFCSYVLLIPFN